MFWEIRKKCKKRKKLFGKKELKLIKKTKKLKCQGGGELAVKI